MSGPFDPCHEWLGISPGDRLPDYYSILGVDRFESDPDAISLAADERTAYFEAFLDGEHSASAREALDQITAARHCLLNAQAKSEYDDWLSQAGFGDSAEAPQDWDRKIEALVELHISLQSRLIESESELPPPPPPQPAVAITSPVNNSKAI